ncbi:MAG: RnfABCDGE type electron transport complex subunit A [Eubacterium sp.]|mgnify:CR=1 FL=1|jgi:electron transport complex, RnfABCDGE type, A subunit|nr:RnfABCDGE type electron transport complex subunit A [Eubacterium sp.]
MGLFTILFTAALVSNFVLSQFLGICPFLGVSKKVETAAGMGGAVIFVITIASLITSTLYNLLLLPNNLEYLNTIVFILVIAALVQFVEMFMKKSMPALYKSLGVYLPLITTNCAVLGVALLSVQNNDNILEATIRGIGASVGFFLAIVLMAGIREKLENCSIPSAMKGTPIVLITAGLMAIAFCGFGGVSF